eukprot:SAG22_NODE_3180_length_1873_cov_1.251973_1_plen_124_part_00
MERYPQKQRGLHRFCSTWLVGTRVRNVGWLVFLFAPKNDGRSAYPPPPPQKKLPRVGDCLAAPPPSPAILSVQSFPAAGFLFPLNFGASGEGCGTCYLQNQDAVHAGASHKLNQLQVRVLMRL